MKIPPPIVSAESPREVFKTYGKNLPIQGGWGYSQADACTIDRNDPVVDLSVAFDGIAIEYEFIENRIREEMNAAPWKYLDVEWNVGMQYLIHDEGRHFDQIFVAVRAIELEDWKELKAEWNGPYGHGNPEFDHEAHGKKREAKEIRFEREFWFDITSFFGKNFSC
ncbi:hypothetical protein [Geoalkalibacter halelectricus]|uniref:Uncharacterized protein n=1 Tax=Geoalkalibacter halelectricus TaxID=2847045 RepID=A0ABY5ZK24_9BACT|nr:hypothetical protein [Geoalkalibacter halelectricus]MDO3377183.1 hypothetical protein [Geoalkalibacter halelectricus]UWZ79471.1 hypothetical protein L9S41_17570 [Geoalkalibacter halelectricus]